MTARTIAARSQPALRRRENVGRGVFGATAVLSLLTAVSWLGSWHWLLELTTHFRVHYLAGAALLAVAALAVGRRRTALVALAIGAANLAMAWPYVVPAVAGDRANHGSARLMSVNVYLHNRNYDRALRMIERVNPDVIGFLEVDAEWTDRLSALRATYPHSVLRPAEGAYGLALFSRFPLREASESPYVEDGVQTALIADVDFRGTPVSLILAHLTAPTSGWAASRRNRQLETLSAMIRADAEHEQVLLGDLNITPWSPHYTRLEQETGMTNAARARGYSPTWPVGLGPAKIPIDHCLLTGGLEARQFRTGPNIGSDHLPVIVDVGIGAAAVQESSAPGT